MIVTGIETGNGEVGMTVRANVRIANALMLVTEGTGIEIADDVSKDFF
jgi:hypothetical protein